MSDITSSSESSGVNARWLIKVAALILWVFLLVAGYFWAHKPFDGAIVAGLGQTILSIAFWGATIWLGVALGRRVTAQVEADEWLFARLALWTGTGLGLLSLALLLLALFGLFRLLPVAALLLLMILWLRRELRAVGRDLLALRLPRTETNLQRWILVYGLASLSLALLLALAPPTAWDSLTYHLTGARFTVETGRIVHPVDIPHLGFPLLGQMQFALGMLFLGDGPAALFHFGYGLLALTVTVALARRVSGNRAAWFAGAILLSIPTLQTLISWPYVDITLLFYATAAFYAFVRWREAYLAGKAEMHWLAIVGLMCGFAGSVKYTAVIIPFALALSTGWIVRREGIGPIIRRLLPVAAIALLLVTPHLIENWLTTGNPVYPFFIEDGRFWDAWRAWWYDRPGTGLAATAPWRLPLVPLELAILGTEGTELYEATVGPLVVLSLGVLLFVWSKVDRPVKALCAHMLLFVTLSYLFWLNGVARTALLLRARFLFFVFGVAAALGGVALARLPELRRPQLDVNWIVQVVVAISLSLILFTKTTSFLKTNPLPAIVGLESNASYLERRLGVYAAALDAVNDLPEDAKVEFLWETRSYGCEVECWPDPILDRFLHYTHYYGFDAKELAEYWRNEGYTHVLLHEAGLNFVVDRDFDPVSDEDLAILHRLQERHLTAVRQWEDGYTLYAITDHAVGG